MTTETAVQPTQVHGQRLKDRVALITGSAQGIGRATAEHFAREGAIVILADVDAGLVAKSAEALAGEVPGAKTLGLKMDVTQAADCDAAVKSTLEKFGKIDILVNNAGITRDNLIMRMSEADWDLVLDINLKGAFNCTKAVSRPMLRAHYGRIVNIASVVGQKATPARPITPPPRGPDRLHQGLRPGVRLPEHPRQRGGSGIYQDPADRRHPRGRQDQIAVQNHRRKDGRPHGCRSGGPLPRVG